MDIESILREHNVPYRTGGMHKNVREGMLGVDCIRCSPGTGKFLLGISPRGYATCWQCMWIPLAEVLHHLTNRPWHEVKGWIANLDRSWELPERKRGKLVVPDGLGPLLTVHRDFLWKKRKINPDVAEQKWGFRGIGVHERLPWRIWIPIIHEGQTVSWTTRAVSERQFPEYSAARPEEEAISSRDVLFGADLARHAVAVNEGSLDAVRIGPGGVATMGLGHSQMQVYLISRFPVRFIVFDAEYEAQRRARELCRQLAAFPGKTTNIMLESGKDVSQAADNEVQELQEMLRG